MTNNKGYYGMNEKGVLFAAKEAYRTIRANLAFSLIKPGCKVVVISSSVPGEGKTTTSANIAFSIARSDKKVLLIDVDLRGPSSQLSRLVKCDAKPGLTNFLSGMNTWEEVLHKNVFTNLDVICSGDVSPNPSEIVGSDSVAELIKKMREQYDYIILDTPPINFVSDALTLISQADGVVLVARPNYTTRSDLKKAVEQVNFAGGKILGVVVNGAQDEKHRYGRYGQRYGYGYKSYGTKTQEENQKAFSEQPKEESVAEEQAPSEQPEA